MQGITTNLLLLFFLTSCTSAFITRQFNSQANKLAKRSLVPNIRANHNHDHLSNSFDSSHKARKLKIYSETSTSLQLTSVLFDGISTFFQVAPYPAAFLTCGFKASAADFIAQKNIPSTQNSEERNGDIDEENDFNFQRNLAFIVYGGMYQGCVQEFIYNHLFPVWFGTGKGVLIVLTKVFFDLLVITPLLCLPIAYLVKAFVFQSSFQTGINRYIDDVKNHGLLKKYWSLWFPVQCLTFSVVPDHFRIVFIACVSFFWLIILSGITSRTRSEDKVDTASGKTQLLMEENDDIITEEDDECLLIDGITCNIDG